MNSKRLRLIVGVGLILLIGVLIAGWFVKGNARRSFKPVKPKTKMDDNVLMGMTIKVPGNDKNSYWELKVDRFTSLEQNGRMKSIKGDYFVSGKALYHISAQSGVVNWNTRKLRFVDQVIFSSNDGKKLTAGEFLWDPVRDKVSAENNVILSSPGLIVTTPQLEGDPHLDKVVFVGETKFLYQQTKMAKQGGKKPSVR